MSANFCGKCVNHGISSFNYRFEKGIRIASRIGAILIGQKMTSKLLFTGNWV